jgi:hypothetical protein
LPPPPPFARRKLALEDIGISPRRYLMIHMKTHT